MKSKPLFVASTATDPTSAGGATQNIDLVDTNVAVVVTAEPNLQASDVTLAKPVPVTNTTVPPDDNPVGGEIVDTDACAKYSNGIPVTCCRCSPCVITLTRTIAGS